MDIDRIRLSVIPNSIDIFGADHMTAKSGTSGQAAWVSLGETKEATYSRVLSLFFEGEGAAEKAKRIADAINAAMRS